MEETEGPLMGRLGGVGKAGVGLQRKRGCLGELALSPAAGSAARASACGPEGPGSAPAKGSYLSCRLAPVGVRVGGNRPMSLSHVDACVSPPSTL